MLDDSMPKEHAPRKAYAHLLVAVLVLFVALVAFLAVVAACSTSIIDIRPPTLEHNLLVADNPQLNLAVAVLAVGLATLFSKSPLRSRLSFLLTQSDATYRWTLAALLAIAAALALAWVLLVDAPPKADQGTIQEAVVSFMQGDYVAFAQGGYFDHYPQQLGFFWVSWLVALVFGPRPYLVLELLNIACYVVALLELSRLSQGLGLGRLGALATIGLVIAFYPLMQYCAFIYGNMAGLALSLMATRYALDYRDGEQVPDAVKAALLGALAVLVKGNYAVVLIALALSAVVWALQKGRPQILLLPTLLVAGYLLQARVPIAAARLATGQALDQGTSSWGWIEMGQQEGPMGPGWYNGYNYSSYDEAGFNTAQQAARNISDLKETLRNFLAHPRYAARFHLEKAASQWNNPTFEGFWIAQTARAVSREDWRSWPFSEQDVDAATGPLDRLQFLTLFGVLAWCVSAWPKRSKTGDTQAVDVGAASTASKLLSDALPYLLTFIGGFLCHVLWEAKPQYTFTYFALLLPFAACGLRRATDLPGRQIVLHMRTIRGGLIAVSVALVLAAIAIGAVGGFELLGSGTATYQEALTEAATNPW